MRACFLLALAAGAILASSATAQSGESKVGLAEFVSGSEVVRPGKPVRFLLRNASPGYQVRASLRSPRADDALSCCGASSLAGLVAKDGRAEVDFTWPDDLPDGSRWRAGEAVDVIICFTKPGDESCSVSATRTVHIASEPETKPEPEPEPPEPEPERPLPDELPAAGPKIPLIDEAAANIDKAAAALAKFGRSAAGVFGGHKQSVQAGLCGIDVGNRVAFMAYLGQVAADPGSKPQRAVAELVNEAYYSLSADDRGTLESALGKSWADASDQEKIEFAGTPSLSGPLFEVLQRVIQEKTPKGLAC